MFSSLLVANRAEIACRIFRTARAMGMRCVGVHSEVDAKAKHVREADESVLIGPAAAADSYLRGDRIIDAAKRTGAAAIHPGYGFLAENPDFAEAVIAAGLIWVGPAPASIRAMGLKDEAKRIAEEAGVPVVPGYRGETQDAKALAKAAREVGFPVLIKAVAGGGGRGIREVHAAGQFNEALASARREAAAAFGDDRVLIEKLIERPRHIEVQVFGDRHGNLVHMFERDCSLQRRRQKVIEEAPAPGMTEEVRAAMTDAALKVARAVNYENAGTVEFIVDGTGPLRTDGFWFLEMNTRLQVEHPVTEAVTGLDLVEWQLRVAAGERLPIRQEEIKVNGHAIEARICAEDPSEGFRPSVGRVDFFHVAPESTRVDAGIASGDSIPSAYDSLVAKLISPGSDRADAIEAARTGLEGLEIFGVKSNAGFLARLLVLPEFASGAVHTGLVSEFLDDTAASPEGLRRLAAAILTVREITTGSDEPPPDVWEVSDGWRLNAKPAIRVSRLVNGHPHEIRIEPMLGGWRVFVDDNPVEIARADPYDAVGAVQWNGRYIRAIDRSTGAARRMSLCGEVFVSVDAGAAREFADGTASDEVKAPLPGKVVAIAAKDGASVMKGDPLVTLEAMKMEHVLKAPRDGIVAEIAVEAGAQVKEGALLVRLEEEAE